MLTTTSISSLMFCFDFMIKIGKKTRRPFLFMKYPYDTRDAILLVSSMRRVSIAKGSTSCGSHVHIRPHMRWSRSADGGEPKTLGIRYSPSCNAVRLARCLDLQERCCATRGHQLVRPAVSFRVQTAVETCGNLQRLQALRLSWSR